VCFKQRERGHQRLKVWRFGLNYGVLYLKLKYGDGFNTTLAILIVAGLVAGSIYLLNKKGDGS